MAVVWRFFVIAFAYGIACVAAAVTLVLGTFAAEGMAVPRDADMVTFLWFFTFATGGAVGLFAFGCFTRSSAQASDCSTDWDFRATTRAACFSAARRKC
jgi:hypothetical protein